ncbi:hypothetical protein ACNKU7_09630 [Microbulbifer sp. SA54]|uniref:hypothetical protein n=1 Tax=Microbulbifer sp. SA54 TaxID=3401577 RepID=UPI003AAA2C94
MGDIYISEEERSEIDRPYRLGLNSDGNYSHIYEYIASILDNGDVKLRFDGLTV